MDRAKPRGKANDVHSKLCERKIKSQRQGGEPEATQTTDFKERLH